MSDDPRSDWDMAKIIADDLAKPKPWWQSKAIIGAGMVLVAQGARMVGLEVDSEAATDAVLSGITLIGAGLAWYGRFKATRPISRRAVAPGVVVPGVREHHAVPPDDGGRDQGYWSGRRGPFDS